MANSKCVPWLTSSAKITQMSFTQWQEWWCLIPRTSTDPCSPLQTSLFLLCSLALSHSCQDSPLPVKMDTLTTCKQNAAQVPSNVFYSKGCPWTSNPPASNPWILGLVEYAPTWDYTVLGIKPRVLCVCSSNGAKCPGQPYEKYFFQHLGSTQDLTFLITPDYGSFIE